jgi:agmatine/peptidylarginine deiminase
MAEQSTSIDIASGVSIEDDNEKTLLVLCAPSVNDKYYSSKFPAIIDYMTNFVNIVNGKDEVVILVDGATLPYFEGKVPSNILIQANMEDIWICDFSSVIPARQVQFTFAPSYRKTSEAKAIDKIFKNWFSQNGLDYYKTSDIILDGGNVVDNAAGTRVIVTDRILRDNPSLTKSSAKASLKQLLGVSEVAIIKEIPGDTTGHADGMVMWPTNDRVLLVTENEPIRSENLNELKISFPNVEIIEIPNYFVYETWRNFLSARNVYVNSIVTDGYIYMPTFNSSHDTEMLSLFQSFTNKTVVPIPAESVCIMGGSVRCLSWQIKGSNKMKILQAAGK